MSIKIRFLPDNNTVSQMQEIEASEGMTLLEAAFSAGIQLPTLYYLKGIQDIDESGICVAESADTSEIVRADVIKVEDGMTFIIDTPKTIAVRKEILERILAVHDYDCEHCIKDGCCELQTLLEKYNVTEGKTLPKEKYEEIDTGAAVFVRDNNKCIRCKRCMSACGKIQGVAAIGCIGKGLNADIRQMNRPYPNAMDFGGVNCVNCGQCIQACPVGALYEKTDIPEVQKALDNPEQFVIVQTAPAVRVSLGEAFGMPIGMDVEGKLPAGLRKLGFDRVFDTKFSADLTIMEEANEFTERLKQNGVLPMMTSCCAGWIRYCERYFPGLIPNLSTCKSPQQMFGSTAKNYLSQKLGIEKEKIVCVSVMPCTAKKYEKDRPELAGDVDFSLTTNELAVMLKKAGITFETLSDEKYDDPLGEGTGAGVIFGASGGVMEAALRTAVERMTGEKLEQLDFKQVRGMAGIKEAEYTVGDLTLKVAAVSGLDNASHLMKKIEAGKVFYDFVEVMACPGGCINGGGQPHHTAAEKAVTDIPAARAAALYKKDMESEYRKSHENPSVIRLYGEYFDCPGSEKARDLLHTSYTPR